MGRFDFRSKTVVITGASGGIGSEATVAFAKRGAKLVLSGRNLEALDKTADRARKLGAETHIVPADVTRQDEVQTLVEKAIELTGGLNVMLLGAGYALMGNIENVSLEEWHKQMNVNFWGTLHGFYAALPHFMKQGSGQFIIINSLSGRVAMGLGAPYGASKFALWGFADCVRAELAKKNIDMISVYPNFVKTSFQANIQTPDLNVPPDLPWKLHGQSPEHVAETIVRAGERRKGEVVFTLMGKIGVRLLPLSYHLAEWGRRLALPIMRKVLGGRNEK